MDSITRVSLSHININWTESFGSKQNIFLCSQSTDSFCCLQHIFNHFSALSVSSPWFAGATRLTNKDTSISPVFYKIPCASALLLASLSCVGIWCLFGTLARRRPRSRFFQFRWDEPLPFFIFFSTCFPAQLFSG